MNIALRAACDRDVAFARKLYFDTMREIITRLFGWDQRREEKKFAQFFKLKEVRIITADGRDVGWIQEQISQTSINLGSFYILPGTARSGHRHTHFADASGTRRQRIENSDVIGSENQPGTAVL